MGVVTKNGLRSPVAGVKKDGTVLGEVAGSAAAAGELLYRTARKGVVLAHARRRGRCLLDWRRAMGNV